MSSFRTNGVLGGLPRGLRRASLLLVVLSGAVLGSCSGGAKAPSTADETARAEAKQEKPSKRPHLTFEEPGQVKDFGEVLEGVVLRQIFEAVNDGDGDLVLTEVKPSCTCTAAEAYIVKEDGSQIPYVVNTPVPPGGRMRFLGVLDTKGKSGQVDVAVLLRGNLGPDWFQIGIRSNVRPFAIVEPRILEFRGMLNSDVRQGLQVISSPVNEPFALSVIEHTLPEVLQVELIPQRADENGRASRWQMRVTAGPQVPVGSFTHGFRLRSDVPVLGAPKNDDGSTQFHEVNCFVSTEARGMVTTSVPFLSFGLVRPGQEVTRTVQVECHQEDFDLRVLSTALAPSEGAPFEYSDAVRSSVRTIEEGRLYEVDLVLLPPAGRRPSFHALLEITTNHPDNEKLEVRFSGVVRGQPVTPEEAAQSDAQARN